MVTRPVSPCHSLTNPTTAVTKAMSPVIQPGSFLIKSGQLRLLSAMCDTFCNTHVDGESILNQSMHQRVNLRVR